MPISKKKPPTGAVEGMDRIIQQIYDDINDIINSVNQSENAMRNLGKGKVGDIKVVQTSGGTDRIEVRTKNGWSKVNLTRIEKQVD
jgi:archaellum component FlaG (FlaF/FlaG flagellin family)